ncbi:phosphoglycerate dehydrogenase-like enzyme [Halomonas fontilapidosi]|uniref:Phosphoglycerate dehydrogenase-like enzyme n=1 Tax=Halomonas fontilapidosi TaxID=616675 RepID=A0A7W5DKV0_9GAMM|nr:NAD(P)-dependent oxidoreductase [Halomonas fontilapidosi]MBB3184765.1 phosphoglycerate dehydrogenase-like enzyme [Halomonas fontilapidosi]
MNGPDKAGKPTVYVLEPIHEEAVEGLRAKVNLVTWEEKEVSRWHEGADAIIVRSHPVSAADISLASRLQVVGKHGAGTDTIDVEAAARQGVAVISTPGVNAPSVADLALAMALSLSRNLVGHTEALRHGVPLTGRQRVGYELAELPAGIIGLGAIGKAVASRLRCGFGATVKAYDPGIADADWPENIGRADSLHEILAASRLLFLHVGLNDATRGMISAAELAMLPEGAFLINCARGGVVNESDLANALANGHLGGAASDVFEQEPPSPDLPLLQHPGFIATPHIGGSTHEGLRRTGLEVVSKVLAQLGVE